MKAYQYDYKPEYSDRKNAVGVLVEDSPKEIIVESADLKGVDVYGLVSMLVNCVNELHAKVERLEAKGA
jgi:hypothetical protein